MSFVHAVPLALFVALPLLPLLLHLLARPRVQTVELPTFRFLFASYQQQRQRTRFLELLLLLVRGVFLVGLLALIARPVLTKPMGLFPEASGREVFLLVDCSASMASTSYGQTAMDRAKEAVRVLGTTLAPDDRVTFVQVTHQPRIVHQRVPAEQIDFVAASDALQPWPTRANLYATLQHLFGDGEAPGAVIYFVTDGQQNSVRELETLAPMLLPKGTAFTIVDVGHREARPNIAIVGDAPTRQRAMVGLPLELHAVVVNHSDDPTEALVLFMLNEQEVERQTLTLKARETTSVRFAPYVPTQAGVLRATYEVQTKRGDAFPVDNRFAFALNVEPKWRVLILNGAPHADPFENETLYLRAALRAEQGANKDTPERDLAKAITVVEETEKDWTDLDETALKNKLAGYTAVVMANVGGLQQANSLAYAALRNYVQDGGGLIIAPGDQVTPWSYNNAFFPTPLPIKDQLTPARLGLQPVGDLSDARTFRTLVNIDYEHPILKLFHPDRQPGTKYFERVLIKKHWPLTLGEGKQATVLAAYNDRTPAIVLNRFGEGKVLLFTFPFNAKWSNWPLQGAEFVPLVLQAVSDMQRRSEVEGPMVVPAAEPARFSVVNQGMLVRGTLTDPRQTKHTLNFERFSGRLETLFEETTEQGFYRVEIGSDATPTATTLAFVVNPTPEEANPVRTTLEQVQAIFPQTEVRWVQRTGGPADAAPDQPPRELWRYVVYLLLGLLLGELLLSLGRR